MSLAERYVELCLRLVRHDEELMDFYFGPKAIAERVEAEPLREPEKLAADALELADEANSAYLRAQLRGLETVARKLAGEEIPYAEEVERCYGIPLRRVPEEKFDAAHRALDEALPPGGSLAERNQRWRDGHAIPREQVADVLRAVGERLREKTRERFGLPEGETFDLELVSDKHWYAFNDYRGGLKSKLEVNADLPINAFAVVALVAHELYPGHHTERTWKEQVLYVGRGQLEESVLPFGTPQSVITEGIAQVAMDIVFGEHGASVGEVLRALGIAYDPELTLRVREAGKPLRRAISNAAILLHVDGASADEATRYLQRWELTTEERARQHVKFVMDRWGRAYVRTYSEGYDLCRTWVNGDLSRFKRLLTEQLTPDELMT
ncbi:MAG TPA: hypothetical protein VG144_10330 [Gaiellaceae bacterium]|nr:hypothetical protein [Gaiellaceae bacterium]